MTEHDAGNRPSTAKARITLMDGGMGKELERIGAPFRQPEWSALALLEGPEWVTKAHRNFIDAGAEVIITNSYGVVPFHIGEERMESRGRELVELAARLARHAADESQHRVTVAGSLPPLFGSYEPERFEPQAAPGLYRVLVEAQAPYVDVWIGETISSLAEYRAVREAVGKWDSADLSLWASFSVAEQPKDGPGERAILRSGESLDDVVSILAGDARIGAVLFNCSQPEAVTAAVEEIARLLEGTGLDLAFGAYANAFEDKPDEYSANEVVLGARPDLTPDRYAEIVGGWLEAGATIVGGCCNIGPDHIERLAATLHR